MSRIRKRKDAARPAWTKVKQWVASVHWDDVAVVSFCILVALALILWIALATKGCIADDTLCEKWCESTGYPTSVRSKSMCICIDESITNMDEIRWESAQ